MKLTCACCQLTDPCIAFPLLLVVSIILSLAYFRGLFGQDKKSMSINVKWGRERLASPFTPLTCLALTALIHSLQIPLPPPDTKLSALRQSLSEHTRLPPNAFKLIYSGAVMKDDNAPRESFLNKNTSLSRSFLPLHPGPRHVSPISGLQSPFPLLSHLCLRSEIWRHIPTLTPHFPISHRAQPCSHSIYLQHAFG